MSRKQGIFFKETKHIRKSGKRRYEIDVSTVKGRYKILKQSTNYDWILALYIGLRSGLLTENQVKNAKNIKKRYGVQIEKTKRGFCLYDNNKLLKISTDYDFISILYNKYINKELTINEVKQIKKKDIISFKKNICKPKTLKTYPIFNLQGKTEKEIYYLSGIYYIRNCLNNKIYIGQSIHIGKRFEQHLYNLTNQKETKHLQNSWNKYGAHNFEFGIICEANIDMLSNLEEYYITYVYQSFKRENGYNIKMGGDNGYILEIRINPELQKDIIEMYYNDISINKIAKKYNTQTLVIREILVQNNCILPGSRHRTDINTNDLIKDYNNGISRNQLSIKYNCSLDTINTRLKKCNLHIFPLQFNVSKLNKVWL